MFSQRHGFLYQLYHCRSFHQFRNPPPRLKAPQEWSPAFNNFVQNCLVKNFEERSFVRDLLRHPFVRLDEASVRQVSEITSHETSNKENVLWADPVALKRLTLTSCNCASLPATRHRFSPFSFKTRCAVKQSPLLTTLSTLVGLVNSIKKIFDPSLPPECTAYCLYCLAMLIYLFSTLLRRAVLPQGQHAITRNTGVRETLLLCFRIAGSSGLGEKVSLKKRVRDVNLSWLYNRFRVAASNN